MYVLLAGSPPFDGPDDVAIMEKVKNGKYHFNGKEWVNISKEAKTLIDKMLTYDFKKRIAAEDAVRDPWIVKFARAKTENQDAAILANLKKPFENLRKFSAKQKLQQATIAFLVHHVSSTDMVQDLRNIFKELDENGDGTLSFDEIKKGFKKFYSDEKIAEKELDDIMKRIDQDNNECIEYEEFIRATVNLDILLTEENLKLAFQHFDKDHSGSLTPDEIKVALGLIETGVDDKDVIKKIIAEIDINGDGNICFDEFRELMIKVLKN